MSVVIKIITFVIYLELKHYRSNGTLHERQMLHKKLQLI